MSSVVGSLGAPLVPSTAAEHQVSVGTAQWALTATMVSAAAATPVVGRWGSGRLRRPVLLGSLALVLAGLVLCAVPAGISTVIAGRALQGLGLAVAPLALAVATETWTGARLTSRLSLLSVAAVAGAGLGYPFSALVVEHSGLRGAYWAGAVLVATALGLAIRHLPRRAEGAPQDVDLTGAALLSGGMVAALIAVSQGGAWGWTSGRTCALATLGVVLLAGWSARTAWVARTGGQPLVDLRLSRRPGVLGPNVATVLLAVATYGFLTLEVLLVRADGSRGWGLGLGVVTAGLVLVPYSLTGVVGSRLAIHVARRLGPRAVLPTGSAMFGSALVLLALCHDELWQVFLAMALGGLGSGFSFSSVPMLVVPHVPRTETGSALSFNQLLRYAGFAAGSALTPALLAAYGDGGAAFQGAASTLAGLCLVAAVASVALPRPPETGDPGKRGSAPHARAPGSWILPRRHAKRAF